MSVKYRCPTKLLKKIIKNQCFGIIAYNIPLGENDYSDVDEYGLLDGR